MAASPLADLAFTLVAIVTLYLAIWQVSSWIVYAIKAFDLLEEEEEDDDVQGAR